MDVTVLSSYNPIHILLSPRFPQACLACGCSQIGSETECSGTAFANLGGVAPALGEAWRLWTGL